MVGRLFQFFPLLKRGIFQSLDEKLVLCYDWVARLLFGKDEIWLADRVNQVSENFWFNSGRFLS